jgi:hypothetical protein
MAGRDRHREKTTILTIALLNMTPSPPNRKIIVRQMEVFPSRHRRNGHITEDFFSVPNRRRKGILRDLNGNDDNKKN